MLDLWEINPEIRAGRHSLCLPVLSSEKRNRLRLSMARKRLSRPLTGAACFAIFRDEWTYGRRCPHFSLWHNIGSRHRYCLMTGAGSSHKGNSHRSPLPFSKCLSQPPVHGKFTNRLLSPYWKRWSLYGRLIMRIGYLSDKLWLEVTPCIVSFTDGLTCGKYDFGAVPSCGGDKSKSFVLAHKLDCCWSVYAPFICVIGIWFGKWGL